MGGLCLLPKVTVSTSWEWGAADENTQPGQEPFRHQAEAPAPGTPGRPQLSAGPGQGQSVFGSPRSGRMALRCGVPAALGGSHGAGASPAASIV